MLKKRENDNIRKCWTVWQHGRLKKDLIRIIVERSYGGSWSFKPKDMTVPDDGLCFVKVLTFKRWRWSMCLHLVLLTSVWWWWWSLSVWCIDMCTMMMVYVYLSRRCLDIQWKHVIFSKNIKMAYEMKSSQYTDSNKSLLLIN
jgi:hypothetical protein